jgi:hypothetical protein
MTETAKASSPQTLILRVVVTGMVLTLWFWSQALIGARPAPPCGIGDLIHNLTSGINSYLFTHTAAANLMLIASSAIVDLLGIFLLGSWLFGGTIRPFMGLVLLMTLRQVAQSLSSLNPPPNMIWHDPGFPTLLVTYHVANDFYFSGHTAIAVLGAIELSRFRRRWLTALAILVVVFEVFAVLVLRAHYTLDVFTALIAAFWVAHFSEQVAPRLDALKLRAAP